MFDKGKTFDLVDRQGRRLGRFIVEGESDGAVLGQFHPGEDYPAVEPLFTEFAERVNENVLSNIDEIWDQLDALEVRAKAGSSEIRVYDVQIFGRDASLRERPLGNMDFDLLMGVRPTGR